MTCAGNALSYFDDFRNKFICTFLTPYLVTSFVCAKFYITLLNKYTSNTFMHYERSSRGS